MKKPDLGGVRVVTAENLSAKNSTIDVVLPTEDDSELFAIQLAVGLQAPLTITFSGDLGAGKTTMIRAILRSLGIDSAIKSPTFSIVESYQTPRFQLHHFDLYRIHDEAELNYIGFRDYFTPDAVCCLEWPERALSSLDQVDISCTLMFQDDGRRLRLAAHSEMGKTIVSLAREALSCTSAN